MKTNRFEENLRKKLESIEPDFEEKDWQQMQTFMRQQAPPSFWQTHGQWAGYALAGATAVGTVVLYLYQSQQNDQLRQEIAALKKTFQQQQTTPPVVVEKTDTVYVYSPDRATGQPDLTLFEERQRELSSRENQTADKEQISEEKALTIPAGTTEEASSPRVDISESTGSARPEKETVTNPASPVRGNSQPASAGATGTTSPETRLTPEGRKEISGKGTLTTSTSAAAKPESSSTTAGDAAPLPQRTGLDPVELLEARHLKNRTTLGRKLANRMPKATADRSVAEKPTPPPVAAVEPSVQPAESQKPERILPDLPVPYRVGMGQQWEGKAKATTVWTELLLGRHWSVNTGLSWLKPQEERYFDEKIFREKRRQEFRAKHGRGIPPTIKVFNITTRTTLIQVPVGVNFRGELGRDFAYLLGVGTNINVRAKQVISYDLRIPTHQIDQLTERILPPTPAFTNVQVSAGFEKRWNPIVLQADAYLISRDSPRSYMPDKQNLGVRFRVLYQFGKTR